MSAAEYGDRRQALMWTEKQWAARLGEPLSRARRQLARAMQLAPGTLLDVRRGRLKSLRGHVERAIDAAFVECLEREIERLGHELEMAKARGLEADRSPLAAAMASRDELISLLAEQPEE